MREIESADVIISIRPEHWRKITVGRKNVELRKSYPTRLIEKPDMGTSSGFTAAVHVTGVPNIIGFIHFYEITTSRGRMLDGSGLTPEQFREYSGGLTVFGWCLDGCRKLKKAIPIEEFGISKPPQSWCYTKKKRKDQ